MPARLLLLVLALLAACRETSSERPLVVFAAASTVDAMTEIARRFEAAGNGPVVCSLAASSTLARQIAAGADADVFLSADTAWMDELENDRALAAGTRVDLLGNTLVWIAPRDAAFPLALTPGSAPDTIPGRIAVGDPEHVPAGRYAAEALRHLGWWSTLEDRLVPAIDVRAAVSMVETGAVRSGIVYATDATGRDGVTVIGRFDPSLLPDIRYPIAAVAGRESRARRFMEYLRGDDATAVFTAAGFTLPQGRQP